MGCSWYAAVEFLEYSDLCDSDVEDFQNLEFSLSTGTFRMKSS